MKIPKLKLKNRKMNQRGAAMITAIIFFLTISVIILVAIAVPVASQVRNGADFLQSKKAYASADTLNEEAIYRLNKGRTLPATMVLSFNEATSTAQITDISGAKQIISTGVAGSFTRFSKSIVSQGVGTSINYGIQMGNGGLTMSGTATINGNVYANGNIIGSGSSVITGTVIAASASSEYADQQNSASGTPAVNTAFGTTTASQDFAQSFTVSTTTAVAEVSFYIKKTGTPANATVKIMSDNAGNPGTLMVSGTLNAGQVTTTYGWVDVGFATNPSLNPGTTYWVVIDNSGNSTTNFYTIATTNTDAYTTGQLKRGSVGGSWTIPNASFDAFFKVFLGGVSSISGMIVGSGGSGDANAFSVSNSTVAGNLYCQTGTGNNKSCDTSQTTASYQSLPFSTANVEEWKAAADNNNVYNGDYTITNQTSTTTGALKINGNLRVSNTSTLKTTGPIWVNGDLTLEQNSVLVQGGAIYVSGNLSIVGGATTRIDASYGAYSNTIVVDGTVNLASSGAVAGSGTTGSYVSLVSNSSCGGTTSCAGVSAISVSGAAGAIALLTQNGNIAFTNSASAKAAVAYSMSMSGSTNITYETGLADLNFKSGPAGSWNVDSWQEISQ